MKFKKKVEPKTATSGRLQKRSDSAINVIRKIIADLKSTCEEAGTAMEDNAVRIAEIEQENKVLGAMREKKNRVINNLENLLS